MINSNENLSLVSVIMPVYNGATYLREAITSILDQTYSNFEFIIINDGSIDRSEEIILSFSDSRIVYIKNPENYKLIKTLNIGFSIAKGCYIARMDADDISHPDRLQKQVQFLDVNEEYGLVGSGVNLLNGENKSQLLYHTDHESLKFALAFYCPFIHPSVMIRSSVLLNVDCVFDSNYVHAEDYELWKRLAFKTKMANIPEYLLDYRVHDAQISSQHSVFQTELATKIRREYLSEYFGESIKDFEYVFKLSVEKYTFKEKYHQIKTLFDKDRKQSIFGGDNLTRYLTQMWKNLFLETSSLQGKDFYFFLVSGIKWRSTSSVRQFFAIFLKTFK
jgi:glycosyltransferase involved in cell wall biosynthesis